MEHSKAEPGSFDLRRRAGFFALLSLTVSFPLLAQEAPGHSLDILERTFREENPSHIREIAEKGEKILMDSGSLGFPHGYYSVDQVCLVLQSTFRSRSTVQFSFLKRASTPDQPSRVVAVGRWKFRSGQSRETTAQIAFTLVRRNGGWTLKELRDVP